MELIGIKKTRNTKDLVYECSICDYKCSRKYDLERHLTTKKHILREMELKTPQNASKRVNCEEKHKCECGFKYKTQSGLWKHKQKCKKDEQSQELVTTTTETGINSLSNEELLKIIMTQVNNSKDMQELQMETQKIFMEYIKSQQETQSLILNSNNINNSNNNMNNCNNKNFNLQIFLNEKCKDAMNITDFVDQIKGSIEDIESIGNLGFVEGVSKIFIRELKSLGVYNRPVHCTDVKRDNLYVKDDDKWEKENEEKAKMLKVIKNITRSNMSAIPLWKKENPYYADSSSKQSDCYNRILLELVTDEKKLFDRVIKNVSKSIVIDKKEV
jgi:hypothetical protein